VKICFPIVPQESKFRFDLSRLIFERFSMAFSGLKRQFRQELIAMEPEENELKDG